MSTVSLPVAGRTRSDVVRVLAAGALVGVVDISYAIFLWVGILGKLTTTRLLQGIAAGLLGRASFQGGLGTAAFGLLLHFGFAYGWTVLFYVLSRRWGALQRMLATKSGTVKAGLLYGPFVWVMMNRVIVPLSRLHAGPLFTWLNLVNIVQHAVMIGLPIALIVRGSDGD